MKTKIPTSVLIMFFIILLFGLVSFSNSKYNGEYYYNSDYNFNVIFPPKWVVNSDNSENAVVEAYNSDDSIYIYQEILGYEIDLSNLTEDNKEEVKQNIKSYYKDYQEFSKIQVTMNSRKNIIEIHGEFKNLKYYSRMIPDEDELFTIDAYYKKDIPITRKEIFKSINSFTFGRNNEIIFEEEINNEDPSKKEVETKNETIFLWVIGFLGVTGLFIKVLSSDKKKMNRKSKSKSPPIKTDSNKKTTIKKEKNSTKKQLNNIQFKTYYDELSLENGASIEEVIKKKNNLLLFTSEDDLNGSKFKIPLSVLTSKDLKKEYDKYVIQADSNEKFEKMYLNK